MGLLRDFMWNFSTRGERYYFCVEGSTQGEIKPSWGEIEMNLGNRRWAGERLQWTLENSETWNLGVGGLLDLHKSGNELSLDLHKSGNELDLHKSSNESSLDLCKSGNEFI